MSEIKLKLCPFCGGEAKLRRINGMTAYVECSKCCAETNHFEMSVEYCANEKAAETWNQRTNELSESTTPIHAKNLSLASPYDRFCCSNCEIELEDWAKTRSHHDIDDQGRYEYEFRYCPNCGAKMDIK